ncbi:MAG: AMP-binding protein, partial [Sciscionella sp.]
MATATSLKTVRDRYTEEEIATFYRSGYWQESSFNGLLAEWAQRIPEATYVCDGTTSFSYRELSEQALRLAVGLRRAGVRQGERVAVQLPNWTEFPLVAAALSRIGAILVPIMPIYRDDEVAYVLKHSGAVAAVTCGEFRGFDHGGMFDGLRAECPELRAVFIARAAGDLPDSAARFDDLAVAGDLADLSDEAGADSSPDDGFMIVYTSGTTSRPKGCFHTFNTLRASSAAIAESVHYGPEDVQFGPSPITHSTGMVTSVVLPLLAGAKSYLMEVWDPEVGLRRIKEYGCTAAVTATPFLQMLMAAYDPGKHNASSLRLWVCAGSPIPGSIVEKSRELFAGCQTLSLYGRSENFLTTMCTIDDPPERSATSDGRALAGAEVRVVDGLGRGVRPGEEGDIAYRGPSHMIEY